MNVKNKYYLYLVFYYLALNIQTVVLWEVFSINLKPFHILTFLFIPITFYAKMNTKKMVNIIWVFVFFLIVFFNSIIAMTILSFPFNSLLINYMFVFLVYILGIGFYYHLGEIKVVHALKIATILIFVIVIIKTSVYWSNIMTYLRNPYAHPEIVELYGGGPNLEATWLVANSAFFLRSRYWKVFLGISLIVSAIYASRIGIVLAIVLIFIRLYHKRQLKQIILFPIIISFVVAFTYFVNPYSLERFTEVGQEIGSISRLVIWKSSLDVFELAPVTGFGAGNAIREVEKRSRLEFKEDNVHNYYLQILLDFGLLGLAAWICIIFWIVKQIMFDKRINVELYAFVMLYFIGGLVQFRGAEPLFWFVMGLLSGNMIYKDVSKS